MSKGAKIKSQDAHKRLNEEFNYDGLVPISDARKALGDRVRKKDFDNYLIESQSNDKIQLSGDDRAPKEQLGGGVKTAFGDRVYMRKPS